MPEVPPAGADCKTAHGPAVSRTHPDGFVVRFATTAVPKGQRDEVVSALERLGARAADFTSSDPRDAPTHLITPVRVGAV